MTSDPPREISPQDVIYRAAELADVDQLAGIRAAEWGTLPYWQTRIRGYMTGQLSPQQALATRMVVVATHANTIIGFAAAHLTRRLGCNGELEWLNVEPQSRGLGIATRLLERVAVWFLQHQSTRVCVDPDDVARAFYMHRGAESLNHHWLVWPDIGVILRGTADRHQRVRPRQPV
jgi:GNAT superfamily N-acetyltransferase